MGTEKANEGANLRNWANTSDPARLNLTMKQLGELAEIRTGYPFRGRIARVESGGCRLVQMGDVRATTSEVNIELAHVVAPPNWQKHVLQPGNVLFVGRGMRNDAATFVGETGNVIAAPHLFVLRARNEWIAFPDYLTWFLNLPETQERIRSIRSGSALPFVPMEAFARLEVPVPSIEIQKRVVGIKRLCQHEQHLLAQIRERRRTLMDGLMLEAVRRELSSCPKEITIE